MANRFEKRRRRLRQLRDTWKVGTLRESGSQRTSVHFETLEDRVLLTVAEGAGEFRTEFDVSTEHLSDSLLRDVRDAAQISQYSDTELSRIERWVVLMEPGSDVAPLHNAVGIDNVSTSPVIPWSYVVEPQRSEADRSEQEIAQQQLSRFRGLPGVIDTYPLVPLKMSTRADAPALPDTYFPDQWHLQQDAVNLNVQDAWNIQDGEFTGVTGEDDGRVVVVGIVDDGVQHTHPDLLSNRWANPGEVAGDANGDGAPGVLGVDDDGDGYIDEDLSGCGFFVATERIVDINGIECTPANDAANDDDENGYADDLFGYDIRFGDAEPAPLDAGDGLIPCVDPTECDGHGTAVAGIIAGYGGDPPGIETARGISGVAPRARFAPIRLLGGLQTGEMEAASLMYANQHIDIYNNSWGPEDDRDFHAFSPMVGEALRQGVAEGRGGLGSIFVWAAGNGGDKTGGGTEGLAAVADRADYDRYVSSRYTIGVAATDRDGQKLASSEVGASVLVAAGGKEIMTTDLVGDDGYSYDGDESLCELPAVDPNYTRCFLGTSAAAPQVAGVVALMLDANPNLTWRDVQHILVETSSSDIPVAGWDTNLAGHQINDSHGFGIVDASAAVQAARTWTQVAPEWVHDGVTDAPNATIAGPGEPEPFELVYPQLLSVETVEISVDITHPSVHDLDISLRHTSPDGEYSVSKLAEARLPTDSQSDLQWTFTSVRHWGESSTGKWELFVSDAKGSAAGTLNSWSLKINGTERVLTAGEAGQQLTDFKITPTGATIIVPGFEPLDDQGDTMLPMAQAIYNVASAGTDSAWLYDFDMVKGGFHASQSIFPRASQSSDTGEVVLLFDWALAGRQVSEGWAEASGDALFSMLVDMGLVNPQSGDQVPLHVIGAGMGASVASETVERLGYFDIEVDHLTYLDPHDFDQGLVYDTAQNFDGLMTQEAAAGYGAAVWDNVEFADVYYQTRGENGPDLSNSLVPQGRPLPGAYNYWINEANYLPTTDYDELNVFGDHEYVWAGYYLSTINGSTPEANDAAGVTKNTPPPASSISGSSPGYRFSRLRGGDSDQPEPMFFEYRDRGAWASGVLYEQFDIVTHGGSQWLARSGHTSRDADRAAGGFAPEPYRNQPGNESNPDVDSQYYWQPFTGELPLSQDHQHSPAGLVDASNRPDMAGLFGRGLDDTQLLQAKWEPQWNPLEIVNGDLAYQGDAIANDQRLVPGWTYYQDSTPDPQRATNSTAELGYLTLNEDQPSITHNTLYIPQQAVFVTVAVQTTGISGDDQLVVRLDQGDALQPVANPLSTITEGFVDVRFRLPNFSADSADNAASRLTIGLQGSGGLEASVRVKDIRFEGVAYDIREGDIATIDLTNLLGPGDYRLNSPMETDTYQLFFPTSPVGQTEDQFAGIVYVAPKIRSQNGSGKAMDPRANISIAKNSGESDTLGPLALRLNVTDGYSGTGDQAVDLTAGVGTGEDNQLLDVLQVQQRLRYLNYRGERIGTGDSISIPEVEVTGALDLATKQAIKLFKASTSPDGNGDPNRETDVVAPHQSPERWLNSPDAPIWTSLRTALSNRQNIGDEVWDTHWTIQKIENAYAARPELKRTTDHEEFGINSLTEYPDVGVAAFNVDRVIHPEHSHKSGLNVDVELDREALLAGDTVEAQNAVDDILAFVRADGVQVNAIYVGANASQYDGVRDGVELAIAESDGGLPTLPSFRHAEGHSHHFSVDVLPRQLDETLPAATRSQLTSALEVMRDNVARSVMLLEETTHTLPMVERSIADSIDLAQAVQLALLDRVAEVFRLSDPRAGDLLAALQDYRVTDDGLIGELSDVVVDIDRTTGQSKLLLDFVFRATQLNIANGGGDLPQNRNTTPDVLDASTAAQNLAIDISFPLKLRIPLDSGVTAEDVQAEVGEISIDASSVSIRNYEARLGLAPVRVVHDPVILEGQLTTELRSSDGEAPKTLAELSDPFIVAAEPTVIANTIRGVLPIEHTECATLTGDPRVTISSDNIFVDTEANVATTADVGELNVFRSLTAADIVGGLDAAINAIRSVTQSTLAQQISPNTPLIGPAATKIIDALNTATDFVEELIENDNVELPFQTINELIDVTGLTLGLRRNRTDSLCLGNAFTLTLDYDRSFTKPVVLEPGSESLGPINLTAGIDAELVANLSFDLDIGFLFGFTDKSESEFRALSLSEVNGGAGLRTVTGPDIEIFVPQDTTVVSLASAAAAEIVDALDDAAAATSDVTPEVESDEIPRERTHIPAQLRTALATEGIGVAEDATIQFKQRREAWHVQDKTNSRTWLIYANRDNPEDFLSDPTGFRVVGPGYLVDLSSATTVQDLFDRIETGTTGTVAVGVETNEGGNVTGFTLTTMVADEGVFAIRPVIGVNSDGDREASKAGEDLELLGIDLAGEGKLGGVIDTLELVDRIYFGPGSGLTVSGEFNAADVDAGVSLFGIGAEVVNGTLDFDVSTSLTLEDSGSGAEDGRLTLRELADGPFNDVVRFAVPRVVGKGRLPLLAQPSALNQEFSINEEHPNTAADDGPEILIDFETPEFDAFGGASDGGGVRTPGRPIVDTPNPIKLRIAGNEEFDRVFADLRNFVPDDFCEALDRIALLLRAGEFGFMNADIPLVNRSLNELLEPDGVLRQLIGAICPSEDDIRDAITPLLNALDNEEDPDRGAIPALLEDLNDDQRQTLFGLREALGSAVNAPEPTPEPEAAEGDEDDDSTPSAATDIVGRLMGVVQRFKSFLEELPNTPARNQAISVLDRIADAVPSVDALEKTIEEALGITTDTGTEDDKFALDFDFAGDEKSIVAIFNDISIVGFDIPSGSPDALSFDFEVGDEDDLVQLSADGALGGSIEATLDLAVGFDLSPGVPFSERIFFDVSNSQPDPNKPVRESKIEISAGLDGMITAGLSLGGVADLAELNGAQARLGQLANRSAEEPANGTRLTFEWSAGESIPDAGLAFVKVGDQIVEDLSSIESLTTTNVTFSAGNAPTAPVSVVFIKEEPGTLAITLQDPSAGSDGRVTLNELFSGPGDASGDPDASFISVELDAGLGANLPFESLGGAIEGQIRAFVDFDDITEPAFQFDAGLANWIDGLTDSHTCNLPGIATALNQFAGTLEDALASEFLTQLPLIGDDIETAGVFVAEFADFTSGLADGLNTEGLRQLLFDTLGPGGRNILLDETGVPITSVEQVDASIPTEGSECVRLDLRIGGDITLAEVDFDLGLDTVAFDFQTNGGLNVGFGYDIQLGMGLDIGKGAYFILNEDESQPEITLTLDASLTDDSSIMVDLFFLSAEASENVVNPKSTGLSGELTLNIDGGSNDELTLMELVENPIGETFTVGLGVMAVVDLSLKAGAVDLDRFPSFGVDFLFEWEMNASTGTDDPFRIGEPVVEFNNFGINLGQYVSNVVSPIIQKIDEYLEPIDPLIDFLSLELPLVSDVATFLGQDPITVVDVIALFGEGGDKAAEFIDTVIKIREIVDSLAGMPDGNLMFEFGDFVTPVDPREDRDLADYLAIDPSTLSSPESRDPAEAEEMLEASDDEEESFLGRIFGFLNDIGVHFPILEEPTSAFGALMGQPVDLVTYDFLGDGPNDRLEAGFDWSITFGPVIPPVPLFVEIFAEFGIFADFQVGLDTFGLQSGTFTDGLYFADEDPVIGLTAGFGAAAELNAGLVWGGVRGGVEAEIGAGWNDVNDDGKFRIPEIAQRASQGVQCIFDLRGSMDAFVEAYAGVGINIFGAKITIFEKAIEILRATIFDFNVGCPPLEPPVLGHIEGDDLIVHIGPHAHLRQNGATDGEDAIQIEQPERGENEGQVVLKGFGQEQPFDPSAFSNIVIMAGIESDNISVDRSVAKNVIVHGGDGDDVILVSGQGIHSLFGDGGNDRLVVNASAMGASIRGGDGDDFLKGGPAGDTLRGDAGNDQVFGEDGDDTLLGGDGDDTIDGGLGSDSLHGEGGNDSLTGGPSSAAGEAVKDGTNVLEGGPGKDFLQGGDHVDTVRGGEGDDTISGDRGNDVLDGEAGDDLILGGAGNDRLTGGAGDDKLDGGDGNDRFVFAEDGIGEVDRLAEASGNDTLDFSSLAHSVTVNMQKGTATHEGRRVVLDRPTRFENAIGGGGDDTFYDSSVNNAFQGNGGDDIYAFGNFTGVQSDAVVETGGVGQGIDTISFAAMRTPVIVDLSAANIDIPQANRIATHTGRTVTVNTSATGFGSGNRVSVENVIGGKRDDSIRGSNVTNVLEGRAGDDVIRGGSGADLIRGEGGNDTLEGEGGDDGIWGGGGTDLVSGGANSDEIHGGLGDDDLHGDEGDDTVYGNGGNDFLFGGSGVDMLHGNAGFDTAWGGLGNDTLDGGQGEDRLFGETGDDTVQGGPGRDFILGHSGRDTLKGGSGDDFLAGGSDFGNRNNLAVNSLLTPSLLASFGDQLDGQSGHDFVVGGQPWDNPAVGLDDDALVNYVSQFFYDMFVEGTSPRPLFFAGDGFDNSPANFVDRYLKVEFADDAADGDDLIHGGLGNDLLIGGDGKDNLYGDWGNDVLFAYRIADVGPDSGPTSTDIREGDRLEGGPNDDGPICGSHDANMMIGGTSEQNLDYILDSRPANENPGNGGYQFVTCTDDPPPLPEFERVEIWGQKFHDLNGNGVRDASEPGLPGWTIELRDVEGDLLATTVTQNTDLNDDGVIDPATEAGVYRFRDQDVYEDGNVENFVEGTYVVSEVVNSGFAQTYPQANATVPVPSGVSTASAVGSGESSWQVLLQSGPNVGDGDVAQGLDFGNAALPRISGFAWLDLNGNGQREKNEPAQPDVNISVATGFFSPIIANTTTDETGFYEITNLQPDGYLVFVDPGIDYAATPPIDSVSVDFEDSVSGLDFAIVEYGSISGSAWHDLNANGTRDTGEGPWADEFSLTTNDEVALITSPTGEFVIDTLVPGIYTLTATPGEGVRTSSPSVATLDQHMFLIESGTQIEAPLADFGFYRPGSIRGRIVDDVNGDGVFTESGMDGITVFLDADQDGQLDPDERSTISFGAIGEYAFVDEDGRADLEPGTYHVTYVLPEDREDTTPDGNSVTVELQSSSTEIVIFGAARSYAIEGSVFYDDNFNGIRDAGEAGLANWLVFLDENGDSVATRDQFRFASERTARTLFDDPDTAGIGEVGAYVLDRLTPGPQGLVLEIQPGWFATTAEAPTVNITNSNRSFDFGVHPLDCGPGLSKDDFYLVLDEAGFPIADLNFNRRVDFADFLRLSGNFGQAGTYPDGDIDCDGGVMFADFLLLSGNFGRTNVPVVEISGQKYLDVDGDGVKSSTEPGQSGWTVQLHDADGQLVAETTTANVDLNNDGDITPAFESGLYYFRDDALPDGNVSDFAGGQKYFVSVVGQAGFDLVQPFDGQSFTVPGGDAVAETKLILDTPTVGYVLPMGINVNEITDEINFGSVRNEAAASRIAAAASLTTSGSPFSYAWIDDASSPNSVADSDYAYNEGGGDVAVRRTLPGQYEVTFGGLGSVQPSGGHVQLSAYGSNGLCSVNSWGVRGTDFVTDVSCFNAKGNASDTRFNIAVLHNDNLANASYAWVNNATASSSTPSAAFLNAPSSVRVSRAAVGDYTVRFDRLIAEGGHVQVTPYGREATRCSVNNFTGSDTFTANVDCVDSFGDPVDSRFNIAVIPSGRFAGEWVSYAWANRPTGQSYTPSTQFSHLASGRTIIADQISTGRYTVAFPGLNANGAAGGHVQVSAYGNREFYCNVESWQNQAGTTTATVGCFNSDGLPANAPFEILAVATPLGDRFEPNDRIEIATDLGSGDQRHSNLSILACATEFCSESDYFTWTADFNGLLQVDAIFAVSSRGEGNLDLQVLDQAGRILQQASTTTANERVRVDVTAGRTYTIHVFGVEGRINENYDLWINGPEILPDRFEENDRLETAASLARGDGFYSSLNVHARNNEDWFVWESPITGLLNLDVVFSHGQGDLNVQLFENGGDEIGAGVSRTDNEKIVVGVVADRRYYVRVFGVAGSTQPDYALNLNVPEIGEDRFESNDQLRNATDLGSGDRKEPDLTIHDCDGEFCTNPDWFRWTAPANGTLDVEILFAHRDGNLDLTLSNANGNLLARSISTTDNESLQRSVIRGETYWINVFGVSGATNPDYDFCLNFTSEPGSIRGIKFEDRDGDGVRDVEPILDPRLSGFTVYLDQNNNGRLDAGERSTVTDAEGQYAFDGLDPGTYIVREVVPSGWTQTAPMMSFDVESYPFGGDSETNVVDLVSADLNADAFGDLAVSVQDKEGFKVLVVAGNQEGVLDDPLEITGPTGGRILLAKPDFDGDGVADLALVDDKGLAIWTAIDGDLKLVDSIDTNGPVEDVIAGDFDNDGLDDLALLYRRGEVDVFVSTGDGRYSEFHRVDVPGTHRSIDAADFNNDDLIDLVVGSDAGVRGNPVVQLLSNSDKAAGKFEMITSTDADGRLVHAADWNQDGHVDIGVSDETRRGSINTPGMGFGAGVPLDTSFVSMDSADFTGDGYPELVGVYNGGNFQRLRVLPSDASGGFLQPVDLPIFIPGAFEYRMQLTEVGDLNGDGNPDIVTSSDDAPGIHVFLGSEPHSHTVTLNPGENVDGKDFGNARGGNIRGIKYESHDCEGPFDGTVDGVLAGFTIYVDLDDDGQHDANEPFDITDERGAYRIENVPLGTWSVREVQQEGYQQAFPPLGRHIATLTGSNSTVRNLNFGNFQVQQLADGNDQLFGFSGEDLILGDNLISDPCIESLGGDDLIHGMQDNDTLLGQQRDDVFFFDGNSGDDQVLEREDGGTDARTDEGLGDRLDFSALSASQSVIANLSGVTSFADPNRIAEFGTRTSDDPVAVTVLGSVTTDVGGNLFIEQLVGGAGDDVLIANLRDNLLDGRGGADVQQGGAGDDTYSFGLDSGSGDQIIETIGIDTLDFRRFEDRAVTVDLVSGSATHIGGVVVIDEPERFENVIGGTFLATGDVLTGNDGANQLDGTTGPDTLDGKAGDDWLIGGEQSDVYLFQDGWGTDVVTENVGGGLMDVIDFSAVSSDLVFTIGTEMQVTDGVNSMQHDDIQIEQIIGGSGDNTLMGGPGHNIWVIDDVNSGTLNGVRFNNIANLRGGPNADEYRFQPTGRLTGDLMSGPGDDVMDLRLGGIVDGVINGEAGRDTIQGASLLQNQFVLTADHAGDLAVTSEAGALVAGYKFVDVEQLTGGQLDDSLIMQDFVTSRFDGLAGEDRLETDSDSATTVFLTSVGGGAVLDAASIFSGRFANVEHIVGGSDNDRYVSGGGSLRGSIDGAGGSNELTGDETPYTFEMLGTNSGRTTTIGAFANVQRLVGGAADDLFILHDSSLELIAGGGGLDEIVAPAIANAITVDGANSGDINGMAFVQIESITGNADDDSFEFPGGRLDGVVRGAGGANRIQLDNRRVDTTIAGENAGTIVQSSDGMRVARFVDVQSLTTGNDDDSLRVILGSLQQYDAGAGTDSLIGGTLSVVYQLVGDDQGTSTSIGQFDAVENLIGGLADDRFEFNGHGLSGLAVGGKGDDVFDLTAGGSVANIMGSEGNDVLLAPLGLENDFRIDGVHAGVLNGSILYSGVDHLVGGTLDDRFRIEVAGPATLVTTIDGQGGANQIDLGPTANLVTITGENSGVATGVEMFANIGSLVGNTLADVFEFAAGSLTGSIMGGDGNDLIRGTSTAIAFTIDAANAGGGSRLDGGFTEIENVHGSSAEDAIEFTSTGSLTGDVFAAGGDDIFVVAVADGATYRLEGGIGNDSLTVVAGDRVATEAFVFDFVIVSVEPGGISVRTLGIEDIVTTCDTCDVVLPAEPEAIASSLRSDVTLLGSDDLQETLTDDDHYASLVDALFEDFGSE